MNRKQKSAYMKTYRKKNAAKIKSYMKAYRTERADLISDKKKEYNGRNVERQREWRRQYAQKNRKKFAQQQRDRRRNKPHIFLLSDAKRRALQYGLDFNISHADVIVPDACPILGIPLVVGDVTVHDGSPSLDRIDPSKGYVSGNVCVISFRANTIKRDSTLTELESIVAYVKERMKVNQ